MRNSATGTQPVQRIYGHGVPTERSFYCAEAVEPAVRVPTIADLVPVIDIMTREVVCARRDLSERELIELMVHDHIGCIPVVEDPGRPVGMVTKLDLVEQLLSNDHGETDSPSPKNLVPRTAGELMMPLAMTLNERATVAHAAAMMAAEDVHHVPIVDLHGRMIGIVSSMDIVRWLARNDGFGATK